MIKVRLTVLICFFFVQAQCQQVFTLQQAIEKALNDNFSIRIARNQSEILNNNATLGNAGMLPQVNLNGSYVKANNNVVQELSNGTSTEKQNAGQSTIAGSAVLEWVLFDGLTMFSEYNKNSALSKQGKEQLKANIEDVIENVSKSYFTVVKEKLLLSSINETLKFYADRLQIADSKYKIGSASKLDYLQSKVDYNAMLSQKLNKETDVNNAMVELNRLLQYSADTLLQTEDTITFVTMPAMNDLITGLQQNTAMQVSKLNVEVNRLQLNSIKGLRLPVITGLAGYYYNENRNDAGLFSLNRTNGPQFGITARYNLFNGFNNSRQISNTKLNYINSQIEFQQTRTNQIADLNNTWNAFQKSQEILNLETENTAAARENASVYLASYRLGSANLLQLNQSQESLYDALVRLVNAQYVNKTTEIHLLRLAGKLIK
ncbi:MAG TPA: TolC family protein [Bacteroidia bacterium]|nr:TolC family protein [Bacteroidia bacterium]MBP7715031.1 TolC family protein [Bacteroidia bacterium]MBP8669646.1 TolC family protein [Bacteroidia bacterium]HOZ82892.1 TolC family protein [Bacteroidia bacterium]HOZ91187.1 TolC family protein [Bacteroidia bacterium]